MIRKIFGNQFSQTKTLQIDADATFYYFDFYNVSDCLSGRFYDQFIANIVQ